MEESNGSLGQLGLTWKRFARRLLTIGENRLEFLTVEVLESRERLLRIFLLALGAAIFGVLAAFTITAAIVVSLWAYSQITVLLILGGIYGTAAVLLYCKLAKLMHEWKTIPASIDQLKKDRASLEKILE